MIIVRFHGGLGNQMFEYSFYEYLKARYNVPIKADLTWFDRNYSEHQGYELKDVFGIDMDVATYKEIAQVHEYFPRYYPFAAMRFLARKLAAWKNKKRSSRGDFEHNYIWDFGPSQYVKNDAFDNIDTSKDWYIEGVYCSDAYYSQCEETLSKRFSFAEPLDSQNQELFDSMQAEQSVAIHVRRGDYVGNVFDIVTVDYYRRAVEYIKSKVDNPVFYVFSDDMDYINREFTFLDNYIPVHNAGKKSYTDMRMISCCKHMIIANSSFSYWGAVIGQSSDSIVIAPKKYKADEEIALARGNWLLFDL